MNLTKDTTNRDLGRQHHTCRICGAQGEFQSYLVREMMHGTKEEFEYFVCPVCDCLQIGKLPDDIGKYYSGGYYSFSGNSQKDWDLPPVSDERAILDVGCGSGEWLFEKAKEGYGCLYGCDPFIPEAIHYKDRVHIEKCSIHELSGEKRFDIIRMGDSLEHVEDPVETMADAVRLLKDNGYIEIFIPSWPNIVFDMFQTHWVHLDAPRHFQIPSLHTFQILCDQLNLRIEETYCDSNEGSVMLSFMYEHGVPMCEMTDEMVKGLFSRDDRRSIRDMILTANQNGNGDHRYLRLGKKESVKYEGPLAEDFSLVDQKENDYRISHQIEEIIREHLQRSEYRECFDFLRWLFFESPGKSKSKYLSEGTMLYSIMLEATLTEKQRMDTLFYERENTCSLYENSFENFTNPYYDLKHGIRRIWFEFDDAQCEEFIDAIRAYKASPELLAVLIRDSVEPEYYKSVYGKIIRLMIDKGLSEEGKLLEKYATGFLGEFRKERVGSFADDGKKTQSSFDFRRIKLSDDEPAADVVFLNEQAKDPDKMAIIFCTNDEAMEQECLRYLRRLIVPEGMSIEVLSIWNAKGMCYGYNRALHLTDAKYKLYIHHDSFLIKRDILIRIKELLDSEDKWKMLGVAGSTEMKENWYWASYGPENVRYNLYQDRILETILSRSVVQNDRVDEAKAVDGVLIATCEDLPWREDLFDGWHFYDISQSFEFSKHGYRVGLVNDDEPWMLHETTARKDPKDLYEKYGKIFSENYL